MPLVTLLSSKRSESPQPKAISCFKEQCKVKKKFLNYCYQKVI